MELYQQMIAAHIGAVTMDAQTAKEIVETESYRLLQEIRHILADDTLTDGECYRKIEAILCLLEDAGSDGGGRHDFG